MSTWRPDSELSRFNEHPDTEWFPVSPETVDVVEAAAVVSNLISGAFDVTVGPLVKLWGVGSNRADTEPPSDQAIQATMGRIDYRMIETRRIPPALRKKRSTCTWICPRSPRGSPSTRSPDSWRNIGLPRTSSKSAGNYAPAGQYPMVLPGRWR